MLFMISEKKKSIGREGIMKKTNRNLKNKQMLEDDIVVKEDWCFRLKNVDISSLI